MYGEVGDQVIGFTLEADEMDRLLEVIGLFDQSVGDQLREDVGDPDGQAEGSGGRTPLERIDHLAAEFREQT